MRKRHKWLCIALFVIASLLPAYVRACSVPVFQYALAYWFADLYEVIIFHRGPLSPEDQSIVDKLQRAARGDAQALEKLEQKGSEKSFLSLRANVNVNMVDLAGSPGTVMQKLWEAQSASELPWMLVKYPRFSAITDDVWSGQFTADAVDALLDSPIRREIARRILDGEVAVWVLLESGSQKEDEAAARLLEGNLKGISDSLTITLPEWSGDQFDEVDVDVSFSMIRLSRSDPAERMFAQMLLNSEWDLKTMPKPMAFPIYGRGRALCALVGDGIRESNIEMACSFLVGWCSCQVKADNPGVDMLMSVNWDETISEDVYAEAQLLLNPLESTEASVGSSGALKRNILVVVFIQILIIAVAACMLLWRKRQKHSV